MNLKMPQLGVRGGVRVAASEYPNQPANLSLLETTELQATEQCAPQRTNRKRKAQPPSRRTCRSTKRRWLHLSDNLDRSFPSTAKVVRRQSPGRPFRS
jgi:hypothetical protein